MKSSCGKYYVALDHVRAVAAFLVFTWHFIHVHNGQHAPPPFFPLSFLTEGHTGVALFMTLSGYLFAKLLDGKDINYVSFLWNRFLRLAPLLFLVLTIVGFITYYTDNAIRPYIKDVINGALKATLPNGGWSITVEFHFYLLLPFLLFFSKKFKYSLIILLIAAVLTRAILYYDLGEIQTFAYWTIAGRIDQFLLGIIAYQFRKYFIKKHLFVFCVFSLFAVFYWYFDLLGGFYGNCSYPSRSSIWIYMSTVEGFAYATLISWYDNSFQHTTGRFSRFIALIGTYSYSIYLLHFFIVFKLAKAIDSHIVNLSNIYLALLVSPFAFLVMIPIGYVSYRFIESPFLKFRTQYIIKTKPGLKI